MTTQNQQDVTALQAQNPTGAINDSFFSAPETTPATPPPAPLTSASPTTPAVPNPQTVQAQPFSNPQVGQAGYNPAAPKTVYDQSGKALDYNAYIAAGGKPDFSNVAKQGLANAQASGTPPPQTAGDAAGAVTDFSKAATDANNAAIKNASIETQLANDPDYQQLLADQKEYTSTINQSQTLVSQYQDMITKAGIPAITTQLLNTEKIINGTEDDIRSEVQAANGFATNSQVLALSSARNKTLIQNYNNLLATQKAAQDQVNTMIGLASADRESALQAITQKLNIDQQVADYHQKFISNAQAAYQNVVNAVGYEGLLNSLQASGDPSAVALAEKTLGLASGGLSQLVQTQKNAANLKNFTNYTVTTPYVITAGGEVQNSQTGEGYSTPEDFQAKTGLTLDQAGKKGLIKPLGQTTAQAQQAFDNSIKQKELGVSQFNAQTSRINATQPNVSVVDTGNGKVVLTTDNQGNILNQQPIGSSTSQAAPEQLAGIQSKIQLASDLAQKLSSPTSVGVGTTGLLRNALVNPFSSKKSDFLAGIQQLTSQLTLDSLIKAKAAGATFGALSEGELNILSGSASKINNWAIKDKNGQITGFNTSGKSLQSEIDKINNFGKLDYVLKGGNPNDVGVNVHDDGTAWTQNSDGSVTQIYP